MPSTLRKQAATGLKPGDTFVLTRTFSQEETKAFGDLTRDYNPVHYDPRWTRAKGFDGLICHGLLVGSMICEFGGQLAWLATGMSLGGDGDADSHVAGGRDADALTGLSPPAAGQGGNRDRTARRERARRRAPVPDRPRRQRASSPA